MTAETHIERAIYEAVMRSSLHYDGLDDLTLRLLQSGKGDELRALAKRTAKEIMELAAR